MLSIAKYPFFIDRDTTNAWKEIALSAAAADPGPATKSTPDSSHPFRSLYKSGDAVKTDKHRAVTDKVITVRFITTVAKKALLTRPMMW